jgi:glycosyltransferase involved in cell wall biosynthesis
MAPRISVLIPTHNRSRLLRLAMSSVLTQTERDIEILVVGDGCTDDTADVVASFADARIHWLDLPKASYFGYANRNVALRQATGSYIAFLTDDDLLLPDHLALLASTLEESDAEWA